MKLVVFGSTGGLGRELVAQALKQGNGVTAFAHRPSDFDPSSKDLRVIEGNVLDRDAVERAIQGQDAVLCALGAPLSDKTQLRAKGTANILRAMAEAGVARLVCVSALGVGDSRDLLPFSYRYLIIPLFMRRLYADHALQEGYIRNSQLEWVIARPGSYTKGPGAGSYRHGFTPADSPSTVKISRADVAEFMLKQVVEDAYLLKAPCISY